MPSNEVLDRLVEVERNAEALVNEAEAEASRRVSAAKERADIAYKASFESSARAVEERQTRAEAEADAEYAREIADYRAKLEGAVLDVKAFNEACKRYLAGMS